MTMPDYACSGQTRQYYVIPGADTGSIFKWWIDGVLMIGFTSREFTRTWDIPDTYLLEVQEFSANGCPGPKKSDMVYVNSPPDILIRASDSLICSGESVIVTVQNPVDLLWGKWMYDLIVEPDEGITGNIKSGAFTGPADLVEILFNNEKEVHKVIYRFVPRIITDNGSSICEGKEVKITVWINPGFRCKEDFLDIPDAFSPNGDGINDVWNIRGIQLFPYSEITIYNRWGQMVWKSERGYPVPWDGRSEGKELPIDSYHYVIDMHNKSKLIVGDITIVK